MSTEASSVLAALSEIVGEDWVKTDPADLQTYGTDWTKHFPVAPSVIVLPKTVSEVQAVVKLANEAPLKLVPSGGRTGLSGGAVATNGEVVLVLDRMNQILDFNAADRQVTCEAGVVTEELQRGYHLNGRVLRHAMVKVSMGPGPSDAAATAEPPANQDQSETEQG